MELAADVLKHVPETIDYEATYKLVADDMNPLNVVLLQEVSPSLSMSLLYYYTWGTVFVMDCKVSEAPGWLYIYVARFKAFKLL